MSLLAYLALLVTAGAGAYHFCAPAALERFFAAAAPEPPSSAGPGVTIFKPLKGLEPHTVDCLASFLQQTYEPYQVLFGVRDDQDPVLEVLAELRRRHPGRDMEIIICPEEKGLNPKISTLLQMQEQARYDLFVVADADVAVGPEYLARVVAALKPPEIGLVSCPYRSGPVATLGGKLEALTIAADFIPSVAMASWVEEIRFALGAAMAFSRSALTASGGFEPLADFLADDYQLGWRIAQSGFQVKILPLVVETRNPGITVSEYLAHQLRWARTYRVCRPGGYLAYGITHMLVWSLLASLASGLAPWSLGLVAAAVFMRLTTAAVSERLYLRGYLSWRDLLLLPLKDVLAFGLWMLAFLGNRVSWGGRRYRVNREGKLESL